MPFDDTESHGGGGGGDDPRHDPERFEDLATQITVKTGKIAIDRGLCPPCFVTAVIEKMALTLVLNDLMSEAAIRQAIEGAAEFQILRKAGVTVVTLDEIEIEAPIFTRAEVDDALDPIIRRVELTIRKTLQHAGMVE